MWHLWRGNKKKRKKQKPTSLSAFVINATSRRLSPSRLLAVTQLNKCAVTPAPHLLRAASFKLEKPATRKMTAAEPSGLFCKSETPQECCIFIRYLVIYSFKVYFRSLQIAPIFSTNSVLTTSENTWLPRVWPLCASMFNYTLVKASPEWSEYMSRTKKSLRCYFLLFFLCENVMQF